MRNPTKTAVLILLTLLGARVPVQAQMSMNDAQLQTSITSEVQTILATLNDPFGKGLGFFSSLGWSTPPVIFDLKDGPRVEIGAGLGAQLVNLPDLSSLAASVTYISPGSTIDIPTFLPLPFPVGTVRVGLFNGLDVGAKLIYVPAFDLSAIGVNVAAEITGFGVDLRFKVVDDPLLPTIAVAGSFDLMTGNVSVSTPVNQTFDVSAPAAADGHVLGTAAYSLDWDLKSFGARVIAGKDLGGFSPYGSIGFQRNSGSVTSTFSGLSTHLDTGDNVDHPLAAVVANQLPIAFEPKFAVGLDVGEGFKFGLLGESNGIDFAAGLNFRGQF